MELVLFVAAALLVLILLCVLVAFGFGLFWLWSRRDVVLPPAVEPSEVRVPPEPGVAAPGDYEDELRSFLAVRASSVTEPEERHAAEVRNEEVLAAIDTLEGRDDAMSRHLAWDILRREGIPAALWPEESVA